MSQGGNEGNYILPIQFRSPALNDTNANGCLDWHFSNSNRSGSNFSGSDQTLGFIPSALRNNPSSVPLGIKILSKKYFKFYQKYEVV